MSNKSFFLNSKLSYNLKSYKSYKFIIFILLLILVAIIFVDFNSLFNNIEGYRTTPCKYNSANVEKNGKATGEKHKRELGKKTEKLGESKSWLGKMDTIPTNI